MGEIAMNSAVQVKMHTRRQIQWHVRYVVARASVSVRMVDALASWPGRGPTGGIISASIAAIELQLVPIHVLLAP